VLLDLYDSSESKMAKEVKENREANKDRLAGHLAGNLNELVDVDLLLDRILANARTILRAEAGTVYFVKNRRLVFATSQNTYLQKTVGKGVNLPFLNKNLDIDNSTLAGYVAIENKILTINNTSSIDPDAPYQHYTALDRDNNYACRAIMTIPLKNPGFEIMGVLQIINPLDEFGRVTTFYEEDEKIMSFFAQSASMALERAIMFRGITLRSTDVVSAHDPQETKAHVQRVAFLAAEIYEDWALKMQISTEERRQVINLLPLACMLHDIGKIRIPQEILIKNGRLTATERTAMEFHVLAGARLFCKDDTPLDRLTRAVILDHHERWDGQGYPGWVDIETGKPLEEKMGSEGQIMGKKGEEISIYGRIVAVADVYDALSSKKFYKEPFDEALSVQIMEQESGHHFDPQVIESFLDRREVIKRIKDRFPDVD
jgi:HD-GYP domain-containing protein (c-di-GMP phosphodiesterase class II)